MDHRNIDILPHHYTALEPWRWRQHGPLKRWCPTITLYGVTTQKTSTWNITTVKTSKLASNIFQLFFFSATVLLLHGFDERCAVSVQTAASGTDRPIALRIKGILTDRICEIWYSIFTYHVNSCSFRFKLWWYVVHVLTSGNRLETFAVLTFKVAVLWLNISCPCGRIGVVVIKFPEWFIPVYLQLTEWGHLQSTPLEQLYT
jgi:hypothetical protein